MMQKIFNILIVDDDQDDALWLSEIILEIEDRCKFFFEKDGIAALKFISTKPRLDFIFLDLNMPLKGGLECLRDIHNHDLLPNTPVIIYSTSNNLKDIDEAYRYGAVYYIVKPTSSKVLRQFVEQALEFLTVSVQNRRDKSDFVLRSRAGNIEN